MRCSEVSFLPQKRDIRIIPLRAWTRRFILRKFRPLCKGDAVRGVQTVKYQNFSRFRSAVATYRPGGSREALLMEDFRRERVYYAPFDYVNPQARLFIIGITPGAQQMDNMIAEAQRLMREGLTDEEVVKQCKHVGSFSGLLRKNLVAMMDFAGFNRFLGIDSCAEVFADKRSAVNLTSAIRYPTFKLSGGKEANFSQSFVKNRALSGFAARYSLEEIREAPNALLLPLGPNVYDYLEAVLRGTEFEDRLLPDLPHPSGANAERIAYFMGQKPRSLLSPKTNGAAIDEKKEKLFEKLRSFR